jgi:hypothetical protein
LGELKGKEAGLNLEVKKPNIEIPVETPAHPVASGGNGGGKGLNFQPDAKGMKLTTNDGMIITTSSKGTAESFVYTIYDKTGSLSKFGVSDAAGVRFNQVLNDAGVGATFKTTGLMPKYQAHIFEKYLRTLHYNSTGIRFLPGMKVPHPIDFNTGLRIK